MNKRRDEIPADERYLHRFATLNRKVKVEEGEGNDEHDFSDIESVNSEEFDLLLGKLFLVDKCLCMRSILEVTSQYRLRIYILVYGKSLHLASRLDRFEPGEKNDVFDIDFAQEFGAEKKKKKGRAVEDVESDGEDEENFEDDEVCFIFSKRCLYLYLSSVDEIVSRLFNCFIST